MAKKIKNADLHEEAPNSMQARGAFVPEIKPTEKELLIKELELPVKAPEHEKTFAGLGKGCFTLTVDGQKRNFDYDFSVLHKFTAKHPALIEAMEKAGYKEVV